MVNTSRESAASKKPRHTALTNYGPVTQRLLFHWVAPDERFKLCSVPPEHNNQTGLHQSKEYYFYFQGKCTII